MKATDKHHDKIARMTFASVYPHYLNKVEKKGRSKQELHEVITWLTGFNDDKIQDHIMEKSTFKVFFEDADLNSNASLIKPELCIRKSITNQKHCKSVASLRYIL
jgi:hypothetical protein